jgi:hypothetical protein
MIAAHSMDHILLRLALRQWVQSMPELLYCFFAAQRFVEPRFSISLRRVDGGLQI